jgi:DNA-binding NtrC family response regulator
MPKELSFPESALNDHGKALSAPTEVVVDQNTANRIEELCSLMVDTCGLIEATLQLAVGEKGKKREAYIQTALNLSARGTKAIKMFLCEWGVLVEELKSRDSAGRSARDSMEEPALALIFDSMTALGLTTESKLQPLAETERRAVINALQETGGDKIAASRILGIARTTLYRKIKEYNLTPSWEFREAR